MPGCTAANSGKSSVPKTRVARPFWQRSHSLANRVEMHTSRTELNGSLVDGDGGFRPRIARAPAGAAETSLIVGARVEQVPLARQPESENAAQSPGSTPRAPDSGFARLRDIAASLLLLVLLLPVLVLLVALVLICDRESPIFVQMRVGRNGRLFKCYKLRSMHRDAERRLVAILADDPAMRREWEASYKLVQDPRVTPLGDFLRRSSLDELPQLFNVLTGSMTLVGPRPVVPEELRRYGRHAACYLNVKPGLTGLWQVTGRSEVSYRRRVATDRLYARRKSLLLDWQILLATVPAVLARKGAY